MNIIYFTHYTGIYGANKSLLELIINMKIKYNVNPIVVTPNSGEFNKMLDNHKIENYSFKYYYWKYLKSDNYIKRLCKHIRYKVLNSISLAKMERQFRKIEIDIVHSNSSCIDIGSQLANRLNKKHLWHIREFGEEDYNLIYFKGDKKCCEYIEQNSEKVIFISNALKNKYLRLFSDINKIETIYNGVNIDNYILSIKNKDFYNEFNIVFAGLICKEKNQIELIRSVEKLVKEKGLKDIKVYFLGDGESEYISDLKKKVKQMDIEDNIIFKGRVENVQKYIKNSQIGVITSNKEAFGRVTVEYMLGGVAVIASNTGANPEILTDNVDGLLYKLGDVNQLSEKIEFLYRNRSKLKEISENAQEVALKRFTSDINCKSIYDEYKNITICKVLNEK